MESGVLKTTNILVVEDNDDHFLIVQLIFEQDGPSWKIHRAASIGEARRWIDDHRGQDFLIISDYRLPDGSRPGPDSGSRTAGGSDLSFHYHDGSWVGEAGSFGYAIREPWTT